MDINSYLKRALAQSSARLSITINIYSPDVDVEMHRKHQCTGLTQFMQQNQRTILIIDDCIEDRETYRRYLLQDSSYTYTILEEEYGENGLELCTKVKPDAILLDCFLPDINGLEFLSELKKKNQTDENQIPVVMITGQEKDAIAAAAIESGAQEYLVKGGMTPETLHLAINKALERKQKEEMLQQSEERYRLLAEATPQFVWIAQPDGSIEYCNRYWYDYTELTALQTLGCEWASVLHPDDREPALEHWHRAQAIGEGYEIEYRFQQASDGVYRWHLGRVTPIRNDQGQIVKWMGTAIDIHDRKHREERLRQSQRFLQRIAETTPNILYVYDLKKQRPIYVNRQITQILGYSQLVIRKMGTTVVQRLMHPDDLVQWRKYIEQLSSDRDNSIFECEYRIKDIHGAWRWFSSRDTVFARMADGSPHQFLGIAEDITSRKQLEAERSQLLAQERAARTAAVGMSVAARSAAARSAAANRAKDEFLAIVSHELRNPLNAILAYAQLLQSRNLNEPSFVRALKTIECNAKLQAKLINDLLDISRITSKTLHLNRLPIELAVVIESVIDTMRLEAQSKAITIESILEPIFGYVLGDEERLQQVIGNLLSNAIKFTPEGGRIQVKLRSLNDSVQVQVRDTGQGIRAEFLPYVFDLFRQGVRTGHQGGLGLGLAIARHLIELQGGTIEADSPGEGKGATFTLKLPLVDDDC